MSGKEKIKKMETRTCKKCKEELPIDEFYYYKYTGKFFTNCKTCTIELRNNKHKDAIANSERSIWALNKNKPGEFTNEYQKLEVHKLLQSIGWIHNPEKNLWYKKGIKDANGNWKKIKKIPKPVKVEKNIEVKEAYKQSEYIYRLYKDKVPVLEISKLFKISTPTVRKIIRIETVKVNEKEAR